MRIAIGSGKSYPSGTMSHTNPPSANDPSRPSDIASSTKSLTREKLLSSVDAQAQSSQLKEADAQAAHKLAVTMAQLFDDDKCTDVLVLDVHEVSPITSYLVIGSGTSERQMRSVLDHAVELAQQQGTEAYFVSTDTGAHWLVADFVHVVTHLFEPSTRQLYDLEMLWGDAPRIDWKRT